MGGRAETATFHGARYNGASYNWARRNWAGFDCVRFEGAKLDGPNTQRPDAHRSSTDRPSTDRPSTDRPSTDRPSTERHGPLMLADFPVLYVDVIVRRTLGSCIVLGVVALVASIMLGQPLAGIGVVLGLGGATINHRLFQVSTVRYSSADGHMERKPYAGSAAARLGALTLSPLPSCTSCVPWASVWSAVSSPSRCS